MQSKRNLCCVALCLFIFYGCSGGGGVEGTTQKGDVGASGSVCVTGDDSYHVEVSGEARDYRAEPDPFFQKFFGSIGGQIRAIEKINAAFPGEEVNEILAWGSGATIKFGVPGKILGSLMLSRPGALTSLSAFRLNNEPWLVYSTQRGLGLIQLNANGSFEEVTGAYRSIPMGVTSVSAASDGGRIAFTTGDGYLQTISADDLTKGASCADVNTTASALKGPDGQPNVPIKTEIGERYAFVLAKNSTVNQAIAPIFEEVYDPIFQTMIEDSSLYIARAVNLDDHKIYELGLDTIDSSFHFYDRFIPTDVTYDGQSLIVVGIAYKKQSVEAFLAQKCEGGDLASRVACMRNGAKEGTLTTFEKNGIFAFNAGFFIYRDFNDFSKAAHFTTIPLTAFEHSKDAPPYMYKVAVDGNWGFVRGPNFILEIARTSDKTDTKEEKWELRKQVDKRDGLTPGIPSDVINYMGGAVSSFTAVRGAGSVASSFVESMDPNGLFAILDTGAVSVRMEGGGGSFVAAIDLESVRGGILYLENAATRKLISDMDYPGAFVSHAAFDGSMLAFVWSSLGTRDTPEASQGYRLAIQSGAENASRAELFIPRSGDALHFKNFPEVQPKDEFPYQLRGVGSVALGPNQKIAVLYTGLAAGKSYYQLGLYPYKKSGASKYQIGSPSVMETLVISSGSLAYRGEILKMTQSGSEYKVLFSTADGIYSWSAPADNASPQTIGSAVKILSAPGIIDAASDAMDGNGVAIVTGDRVTLKDLASPTAAGFAIPIPPSDGAERANLLGARAALAGNALLLAAPYGAKAPFFIFGLEGGNIKTASTCSQCQFLDVKIYNSFRDYLLVNSIAGGIEVYRMK